MVMLGFRFKESNDSDRHKPKMNAKMTDDHSLSLKNARKLSPKKSTIKRKKK